MATPTSTPLKIYKASAGSGKTFTLAVEYITLLMVNPMEYQNILAVTFTNKATAEMKQRILGTLYGLAHGLESAETYADAILKNLEQMKSLPKCKEEPYRSALQHIDKDTLSGKAKEALSNIIHDYSRFHIETIDSFFQGIVREIASELELPTKMKVVLDETEVLSDAIDNIIDNLDEHSNEFRSIVEFIEEKIKSSQSWKVNETVKEFGRNIFKENYLVHGEEVRRKITDFGAIVKYREHIKSHVRELEQEVTAMGSRCLEAYEQCGMDEGNGSKSIVTFFEKVANNNILPPKGKDKGTFSDSIAEYMYNVDKWFKKNAKKRDRLQPEVEQVLMPMLKETFECYHTYLSHAHTVDAIMQHLYSLMLLNRISEQVKSLNNEANRFLLSETANFLRNVINKQDIPFIYEKTGAVIKHIMIDEFQDTSALQWGNFKPLILNSMAMDGSCLIVGDVKQSIYRFRNSDWRILNSIENDYDLQGLMSQIPAKYNYRSSRRVVEFNNTLFKNAVNLLKAWCPALTTAYGDVEQKAKKNEDAGFVRIENIDYHDIDTEHLSEPWDKATPENLDEAMLQRIQLSVKELMGHGVKANDITILIRTNKEVPLICDYFNAHPDVLDVKVVSDDAFRLDASEAVNIIIDALRVLAAQNDELHLLTLEHHLGRPIPQQFGTEARKELQFKALTELVEEFYQIFQLNQLQGQDAYLFYFCDIVKQFCEDNQADIDTFLQAWDEQLCEKTIPNGAADGVRIMTMHKSKGLEFHSVIIPSCSWAIKPKGTEVMWCQPKATPYNQMPLLPISVNKAKDDSFFADDRKEEELKTLVDNINVLYVAFTRAKHNLVILTGNKMGKQPERIGEGEGNTGEIEDAQSFLIQAMPEGMEQRDIDGCITTYQCGTIMPTTMRPKEGEEKEKNVMECDYAALPVSFVSYPTSAEFRQSNESDLFITGDSPNPVVQGHAERVRLISLGNLYHNIFQHVGTIDDVPNAVQRLQSKGCFGTMLEAAEAQENVTRLIGNVSANHPEWFSPDWTVLNERAILFLDQQGHLANKRPDRVIVNGTRAIVIDYKTAQGVVTRKPDGTLAAPSENVAQIRRYTQLLAQLGYTDVEAYLWYILDEVIIPV